MTLDEFFDKFKNLPNKFHFTSKLHIRDQNGMCPIAAMCKRCTNSNASNMMAYSDGVKHLGLTEEDSSNIVKAADGWAAGGIRNKLIMCRPELIVPEMKRKLKEGMKS